MVPSHEKGLQYSGIRILAHRLLAYTHPEDIGSSVIIDGTNVLERTKTIEKKTDGGMRDIDYELSSLAVRDAHLIKGKQVLLLDDVTTTGTSLSAGKRKLLQAGAKIVIPLALGETWKYRMFGM